MKILTTVEEEKEKENITDAEIFNINQELKEELIYIRKEIIEVGKAVYDFLKKGYNSHSLVIGTRGSGKTGLIKYLLAEFKQDHKTKTYYINCRTNFTSYRVMKKIINSETYKQPSDEVAKIFQDMMSEDNTKKIIFLDEIDLLKDDNVLYNITREPEFKDVTLIMATNKIQFYNKVLSEDVKSSLTHENYFFDRYDVVEIIEILTKRAKAGLTEYSADLIRVIAAVNVKNFQSDIRIGIKALFRIHQTKEFKNMDHNNVINIMMDEYTKIKNNVIEKLEDNKLRLLKIICDIGWGNEVSMAFKKEVDMVTSQFFLYLTDLENLDLVHKIRKHNGKSSKIFYDVCLNQQNKDQINNILERRGYD